MPPKKALWKNTPFFLLSTASSKKEAQKLSRLLVTQKLAACVNIIYPADSFFSWKGKYESAKEAILFIKTKSSQVENVRQVIERHHSYDVPEVIGWPIRKGNQSYLDWLSTSVK